jgi:hypothetical protein
MYEIYLKKKTSRREIRNHLPFGIFTDFELDGEGICVRFLLGLSDFLIFTTSILVLGPI